MTIKILSFLVLAVWLHFDPQKQLIGQTQKHPQMGTKIMSVEVWWNQHCWFIFWLEHSEWRPNSHSYGWHGKSTGFVQCKAETWCAAILALFYFFIRHSFVVFKDGFAESLIRPEYMIINEMFIIYCTVCGRGFFFFLIFYLFFEFTEKSLLGFVAEHERICVFRFTCQKKVCVSVYVTENTIGIRIVLCTVLNRTVSGGVDTPICSLITSLSGCWVFV